MSCCGECSGSARCCCASLGSCGGC
jgi:hypothetical protein